MFVWVIGVGCRSGDVTNDAAERIERVHHHIDLAGLRRSVEGGH